MQTGKRDLIGLKERKRGLEGRSQCMSEKEMKIKGATVREEDTERDEPKAISASLCPSACLLSVV